MCVVGGITCDINLLPTHRRSTPSTPTTTTASTPTRMNHTGINHPSTCICTSDSERSGTLNALVSPRCTRPLRLLRSHSTPPYISDISPRAATCLCASSLISVRSRSIRCHVSATPLPPCQTYTVNAPPETRSRPIYPVTLKIDSANRLTLPLVMPATEILPSFVAYTECSFASASICSGFRPVYANMPICHRQHPTSGSEELPISIPAM